MSSSRRLSVLGVALALSAGGVLAKAEGAVSPLDQVRSQFVAYCLGGSPNQGDHLLDDVDLPKAATAKAPQYLTALRADGTWEDVMYKSDARSAWQPFDHLTRMLAMTLSARQAGTSAADSAALLEGVHRAFAVWIKLNPICLNWWYNEIGVPKILGTTGLLLGKDLTDAERTYITTVPMERFKVGARTGQNRVWLAGNSLMDGLLKDDAELVGKSARIIQEEIVVTTKEGLQPDFSFHQHGPQQQFGNYGLAFTVDNTRWALILRNTPFALSTEKRDDLRNYLLEGQNWVSWRGMYDVSACGRQLFPNSQVSKFNMIAAVMNTMPLVDPEKATGYRAFSARNTAEAVNDLWGTRAFYRSDYLVHRGPVYMTTLRLNSSRTLGGETVNSEDLSGNHMGDGATYFYMTGHEYQDIFPVWNWRLIPGTTAVQDKSSLEWEGSKKVPKEGRTPEVEAAIAAASVGSGKADAKDAAIRLPVGTAFTGVLDNGVVGLGAMDFRRGGLRAKKAWFYDRDNVACLGAGITSTDQAEVVTTVEQSLAHGEVVADQTTLAGKGPRQADAKDIRHGGFEYHSLQEGSLHVSVGPKTGNWREVFKNPSTPQKDVTKDVFLVTISQGKSPVDASYAYAVMRAESPVNSDTGPRLLANTSALQAVVFSTGNAQAVFWQAGELKVPGGDTLSVDQGCLAIIDFSAATHTVRLSDPTCTLAKISGKWNGKAFSVELPRGLTRGAGASIPE